MNLRILWKIKFKISFLYIIFCFPYINVYAASTNSVFINANIVSIKCIISYPDSLYFGDYIGTNFKEMDAIEIKKITISLDCSNINNIVTPVLTLQGAVFPEDKSIFTDSSNAEQLNVGFMFKKGTYNTPLNFKDKDNIIYQNNEISFDNLQNGINIYDITVGLVKGPRNSKVNIGSINAPVKFTILYK